MHIRYKKIEYEYTIVTIYVNDMSIEYLKRFIKELLKLLNI